MFNHDGPNHLGLWVVRCVLLVFDTPNPFFDYEWIGDSAIYFDVIFLFVFTAECIVKVTAFGFMSHQYIFVRRSAMLLFCRPSVTVVRSILADSWKIAGLFFRTRGTSRTSSSSSACGSSLETSSGSTSGQKRPANISCCSC